MLSILDLQMLAGVFLSGALVYSVNDTLKIVIQTECVCVRVPLSHTASREVYTVKVAATTGGGRAPYSDSIYMYIPKTGKCQKRLIAIVTTLDKICYLLYYMRTGNIWGRS